MSVSGISAPAPNVSESARIAEQVASSAQGFVSAIIQLRPEPVIEKRPVALPPRDEEKAPARDDELGPDDNNPVRIDTKRPDRAGLRSRPKDEARDQGPDFQLPAPDHRALPSGIPPAFAPSAFVAQSLSQDYAAQTGLSMDEPQSTAAIRAAVAAYGRNTTRQGDSVEILVQMAPGMPRLASGRMVDLAV